MSACQAAASIHASAVLAGPRAVLIRGPSGAGKSRLAIRLIEAGSGGRLPFARLVADDRALLEARHGRLLVRPAQRLAGLIEIRGIGICRLSYEPVAVVGLVVDLDAPDAERLPPLADSELTLCGVALPRLAVGPGIDPVPITLTRLMNSCSSRVSTS